MIENPLRASAIIILYENTDISWKPHTELEKSEGVILWPSIWAKVFIFIHFCLRIYRTTKVNKNKDVSTHGDTYHSWASHQFVWNNIVQCLVEFGCHHFWRSWWPHPFVRIDLTSQFWKRYHYWLLHTLIFGTSKDHELLFYPTIITLFEVPYQTEALP